MNISERIEDLEKQVKEVFSELTDGEQRIIMKVLALHADKVHIKHPDLIESIVKVFDGEIK
ncbi:MAG: hypothetical protein NXH75_03170 [Halobacteriovoraceae bacterium]|nr:hypothetical protein [Halobacteriovoraceae bacterium]